MWFLSELVIQKNIPEKIINKFIFDNNIKVKTYTGSDGRHLGFGVSDKDAKKLFREVSDGA